MANLKSICVYCGASVGGNPEYARAASKMGELIATSGRILVYGGGGTGLMGETARAAMAAGGRVVGVIPARLNTIERANHDVELRVVETMHERKQMMADLADGFIALPGGLGTFDELFEILTWAQIGLHKKPVGLLNTRHYFNPLLAMIEHARTEGFIYEEHLELFTCDDRPQDLLDSLVNHQPPQGLERWLTRED